MTAADPSPRHKTVKVTPVRRENGSFALKTGPCFSKIPPSTHLVTTREIPWRAAQILAWGRSAAILLTHAHGGSPRSWKAESEPERGETPLHDTPTVGGPETNLAEIASRKIGGHRRLGLASFLSLKMRMYGEPLLAVSGSGPDQRAYGPRTTPCTATLFSGGKRMSDGNGQQACTNRCGRRRPPNDLSATFFGGAVKPIWPPNNLSAYVGIANGFRLTFTNGLTAYLSGRYRLDAGNEDRGQWLLRC